MSGVIEKILPISRAEQSLLGEMSQEQDVVFQVTETRSAALLGT